jgi:ABC-type branched-subunit amino acid transport system substrate-binding protein
MTNTGERWVDGATDPQSAVGHINRGIDAHGRGDEEAARRHFAEALLLEPDNEVAWLWMVQASSDPAEQLFCLNRAVGINPDSKGRVLRDQLRTSGVSPISPQAISDLNNPPLPPLFAAVGGSRSIPLPIPQARRYLSRRVRPLSPRKVVKPASPTAPNRHWPLWLALCLLLVAMMSFFVLQFTESEEPLIIAVVGPMSGEDASIGEEMRRGAEIAVDTFNAANHEHVFELRIFDDRDDPERAVEIAREIVEDPSIIGVVGHGTSTTSLAAAPIYAEAGMPAISGQATTNELSAYPDYFRTIFSNESEAILLSKYIKDVFEQETVTVVAGDSDYEQALNAQFAESFAATGGTVDATYTVSGANRDADVTTVVEGFGSAPPQGMLVMLMTEENGHQFLLNLRRAGIDVPIVTSESMGSNRFASLFADEPEEQEERGYFTNGVFASSPMIYDAVGSDGVVFSRNYLAEFGIAPSWRPARNWDAVTAMATAADRADLAGGDQDVTATRAAVAAELHAMKSPEEAFRGLTGPIFFTENGDSPQGLSMGEFDGRRLGTTSKQYRLVVNTSQYDMEEEVAAGRAVEIDGYYVREYRVVYVGVEMIELRDLNTAAQSFQADFFMWFRYDGDDEPVNITFTNAANASLALGEPLNTSVTDGGMNYRLYRVQGNFNEPMDFSDYPWDRHDLTIRFQNPTLKQNDLVYVADPAVISLSQPERLVSATDQSRDFNNVPSWNVESVLYTQAAITTTADDYDIEGLVQYSEFRIVIDAGRDVNSFLGKNLLPLVLLTLVTYIAIWFPAEQAGARVGFAITALLSSSVMLGAISTQLPDIGYTVAIEWGYYAYIGLSALLVLLTVAVDRSYKAKRMARVRTLDAVVRIGYPLAIFAVVAVYWIRFY